MAYVETIMITASYGLTATERVLPRLALDWTTGLAQPGVDTSRAGVATFVGSNGLIQSATANTQRLDWAKGTSGLLVEESRVNRVLNSILSGGGSAPLSFTQPSATGTSTPVTSIKTTTGSAYLQTASAERPYLAQSIAVTAGTTYTLSMVIESTTSIANSLILGGSGITITQFYANGVAVAASDNAIVGVLSAVFTAPASISYNFRFGLGINQTVTGSLQFSCLQLEAGAFATSYIPTEATVVTRNADVATMTGTNFSDWYNPTEGTFVFRVASAGAAGPSVRVIFAANDGTANNQIRSYMYFTVGSQVTVGGAGQATLVDGLILANNTFYNGALGYKANNFGFSLDARTPLVDTSGTVPTIDQLQIGSQTSLQYLNGHIQKLFFYPQKLITNEIQAFSKG
jgi:hypothetical protein